MTAAGWWNILELLRSWEFLSWSYPCKVWILKIYYYVHKNPPLVTILSQINLVRVQPSHIVKTNFSIYKVCLKSNETERVVQELATLQPCLRHQLRCTSVHEVQCKFHLDSMNTSDWTASCVCVVETRYENGETKSRAAFRYKILCRTWRKRNRNLRNIKTGLRRACAIEGTGFLGGMKHFWMAVRVWKTNLVLEDLARQKRRKCDQSEGCHGVW